MAVLIPNMPMPESCSECRFEYWNECLLEDIHVESVDRHPKCPLVEVMAPKRIMSRKDLEAAGFET